MTALNGEVARINDLGEQIATLRERDRQREAVERVERSRAKKQVKKGDSGPPIPL